MEQYLLVSAITKVHIIIPALQVRGQWQFPTGESGAEESLDPSWGRARNKPTGFSLSDE